MVSANDTFCVPASVTNPDRSECAEKPPSKPANAERFLPISRTVPGVNYFERRSR
jgi:hypothetical protein